MKALWCLLVVFFLSISGCNKELGPITDTPLDNVLEYTELDNEFLAAMLKNDVKQNQYAIVSHDSYMEHSADAVSTIDWLDTEFQYNECEIREMIEALFEKNKKPKRLTLKSSKDDGFVVDYEGKLDCFVEGKKGFRKWLKENPDVQGYVRISLPVIGKNGLILIYYEIHYSDAVGRYDLYQYKDKQLKYLTSQVSWTAD